MANDLTGDGIPDLLVGQPGHANQTGRALVFSGSDLTTPGVLHATDALHDLRGVFPSDEAGYRVASAGDVDDDGLEDLLIGIPDDATGATEAGSVALFFSGNLTNGAPGVRYVDEADHTFYSSDTAHHLGEALTGVGDLNGDGRADFALANVNAFVPGLPDESGAVYLFFGGP